MKRRNLFVPGCLIPLVLAFGCAVSVALIAKSDPANRPCAPYCDLTPAERAQAQQLDRQDAERKYSDCVADPRKAGCAERLHNSN